MTTKKKVIILGNGFSRLHEEKFIDAWKEDIWGCNHAYKDYFQFPRLNRIFTVHKELFDTIIQYKKDHELDYIVYGANKDVHENTPDLHACTCALGFSSGSLAIIQALEEKYDEICLVGFDFGGKDVYQTHLLYGGNFIIQFQWIRDHYDTSNIYFIPENNLNKLGII